MDVQVNQTVKTADFTSQYSSARKSQESDGSDFMAFLKDAKSVVENSQNGQSAESQNADDVVLESEQGSEAKAVTVDFEEAAVEIIGPLNSAQDNSEKDPDADVDMALLMGMPTFNESTNRTEMQISQEMQTEQSNSLEVKLNSLTSGPVAIEDNGGQESGVLSSVSEDVFNGLVDQATTGNILGEYMADGLNKQPERAGSALVQTVSNMDLSDGNLLDMRAGSVVVQNDGTEAVVTEMASTDELVDKLAETSASTAVLSTDGESVDVLSLNEAVLRSEAEDVPDLGSDGSEPIEMQGLSGVKTLAVETKVESSQVLSQVQQAIVDNYEENTDKTFKLTLNPESLGEIDVEMEFANGKMSINILAASQETHELLSKQIDQLIRGLGIQKVTVETVTTSRSVEETADSGEQSQSNLTNMDFRQGQQQEQSQNNLILGRFNRMSKVGLNSGESLDESLTSLAYSSDMSSRFSRLNYLV